MAGMVSLVNAARRSRGNSTLGFLNPALYALHMQFTNDVTSGDNRCVAAGSPCCEVGFTASEGWDPVTGLGSINFEKFKRAMMALVDNTPLPAGADGEHPPISAGTVVHFLLTVVAYVTLHVLSLRSTEQS
jgi:hypothetical protein